MVVVVGRGRGALTATSCDSSKTQDEEVQRRQGEERRSQGEKGVQRRQGSLKGDVRGVKEMSEETMRSNRSIPIDNITCNQ